MRGLRPDGSDDKDEAPGNVDEDDLFACRDRGDRIVWSSDFNSPTMNCLSVALTSGSTCATKACDTRRQSPASIVVMITGTGKLFPLRGVVFTGDSVVDGLVFLFRIFLTYKLRTCSTDPNEETCSASTAGVVK